MKLKQKEGPNRVAIMAHEFDDGKTLEVWKYPDGLYLEFGDSDLGWTVSLKKTDAKRLTKFLMEYFKR